jgi:hypothetical protein
MLSNLGLGDIAAPENKNTGARKMSKRRFVLPQSEKLFTAVSVRTRFFCSSNTVAT